MTFKTITLDISKKENGKHKKIGDVAIMVPTLADLLAFVGSEVKKDDKGQDVVEEGLPVYVQDEANWIQAAVLAAAKAQARGKLQIGTATLKEGAKIPTTWAELCAEGVRDGSGLILLREFKALFSVWAAKQGLSEAAQNTLVSLVSNKSALALQNDAMKAKVSARLEQFAESLSEADAEKFMRPFDAVVEACKAADAASADF